MKAKKEMKKLPMKPMKKEKVMEGKKEKMGKLMKKE